MNSPKTNQSPRKRDGVGDYGMFQVTHEVFRPIGKGKMMCLTTGEIVDYKEFKRRGKGTWLKVTEEPTCALSESDQALAISRFLAKSLEP